MPAIKVPTSFNIDVEFDIPEFYRRLFALLIDWLVIYLYLQVADYIYDSLYGYNPGDPDAFYNRQAVAALFALPILLYHPACEITLRGQSIGKKLTGMRVVNENGVRASVSQFLIRWLLRDIWFIFLFFIGLYLAQGELKWESVTIILLVFAYFIVEIILVVSSRKGQRLGDILARTILIKKNPRASIGETIFQEVEEGYKPSFPAIMKLSDRDINAVKTILETARRKGDFDLAASAAEKIKKHLSIQSSLSPFDFLEILLKDYNYLSVK